MLLPSNAKTPSPRTPVHALEQARVATTISTAQTVPNVSNAAAPYLRMEAHWNLGACEAGSLAVAAALRFLSWPLLSLTIDSMSILRTTTAAAAAAANSVAVIAAASSVRLYEHVQAIVKQQRVLRMCQSLLFEFNLQELWGST